jgi:hypothetical protein
MMTEVHKKIGRLPHQDAADTPPSDEVVSEAVRITQPGFPISTAQTPDIDTQVESLGIAREYIVICGATFATVA